MDVVQNSSLSEGNLSPKQPALGLGDAFVSGNGCGGPMVPTCEPTKNSHFESFRSNLENGPENVDAEPLIQKQVLVDGDDAKLIETEIMAPELTSNQRCGQVLVSPCESGRIGDPESQPIGAASHLVHQDLKTAPYDAVYPEGGSGHEPKILDQSRKRRSSSTPPVSNRILRSRSQEKSKDCEPKDVVAEDGSAEANLRKRRKKKAMRKMPVDQFSRIKAHLRYLLHRINYEQNLIDAYSGEGWRGQSVEKIKPEKELQRAKSQIFRYKLKIRDLFQRIDMSLTEGKLPETLFDTDGQIDSEDIFCAKCGSKDLTLDNDIILCDGACERGFHQFCLEPPLLKEDIPPDEEGWLCPGCDCKVDCMEMLSDFQGSNFSVLDTWEKVFPEEAAAAAAAPGMKMDDYSGLPSDDSEDDDYDPDKPEQGEIVSDEASSSDGSDYFSACDDQETALDEQILGLPSEDSEDDDFDPSAPDHSDHAKQESSSSDFTSDSDGENFDVILDGDESLGNKKVKVGRAKRQSLSDEIAYLMQSSEAPISAKRHVERLDYKKLHQETYGDTSSDSSDEDYGETAGAKRENNWSRKDSMTQRVNICFDTLDGNNSQKESEKTPPEKSNKNRQVGSSNEFAESESTPADDGSNGKSTGRSYKRLEDSVVQRLFESFRENQYPKHEVKESLAKELGIRIQQVSKWFENARWSYRHSGRMESKTTTGNASTNGTSSPQISGNVPEIGSRSPADVGPRNGPEMTTVSQGTRSMEEGPRAGVAQPKSSSASSQNTRKRRVAESDNQNVEKLSSAEKSPERDSYGNTSKSQRVRRSSRLQIRSSS